MCNPCHKAGLPTLNNISKNLEEMNAMNQERMTRIETKMQSLETSLDNKLTTNIENLKQEIKSEVSLATRGMESRIIDSIKSDLASSHLGTVATPGPTSPTSPKTKAKITIANLSAELQERDEKMKNIVIFKLVEPNTSVLGQKIKDDTATFIDIASTIKINVKPEEVARAIRLGKAGPPNRPRPLLVTLHDPAKKASIFESLRLLKGSKYAGISVAHDKTKLEREMEQKLFEEAKSYQASDESGKWLYKVTGPAWNRAVKRFPRDQPLAPKAVAKSHTNVTTHTAEIHSHPDPQDMTFPRGQFQAAKLAAQPHANVITHTAEIHVHPDSQDKTLGSNNNTMGNWQSQSQVGPKT